MEERALVIEWDDSIKINVVYLIDWDSDEPGGWFVSDWWISSLVVGDTSHTDSDFIQYLYDTMSDKHRDYIQAACEEYHAVHLDQKWS